MEIQEGGSKQVTKRLLLSSVHKCVHSNAYIHQALNKTINQNQN